jgi:hypothetical protein
MRKPLIYSALIHFIIVAATIIALPARKFDPVPTRVLPVELLTVAEMTNLKRQAKKEAEKPKPVETPKPKPELEKPKPTPVPPTPEKAEPTPPAPEEKVEPIPDKTAEKKPEEKKPEPPKPEKAKPAPVKKPVKKKPAFDPSNIAALLNKIPDKASQPDQAKSSDEKADAPETDDPDLPMTVSELDALRQKINQCFNAGFLAAAQDADKLYADISFELAEDGSVLGVPSIDGRGPGASDQLAVIARKAVVACSPYDKLPRDKYQTWKDVTARFTVAGMM